MKENTYFRIISAIVTLLGTYYLLVGVNDWQTVGIVVAIAVSQFLDGFTRK